jgi:hypothetical protein
MSKTNLRTLFRAASTLVAFTSLTASAMAADECARPNEAIALQTAAVQQQLMVAALVCRESGLYNSFVIGYQDELQRSDAVLQHYFESRSGGIAAYHAYKTRLANAASLESIHDDNYCGDAGMVFHAALASRGAPLSEALGLDGNVPEACREETRMASRAGGR